MFHLLLGIDDYQRSLAAKKLIDKLVPPESRETGLEVYDGLCDKMDDVISVLHQVTEALYMESFFGDKVVYLRNANFLPGSRSNAVKGQGAKDAVAEFCQTLMTSPIPESTTFILSADSLLKTTKFAKWTLESSSGVKVQDFGGELKGRELTAKASALAREQLKAQALTMSEPVLSTFLQYVGTDSRTIVSEIEKLRTYLGKEGPVTLQDIAEVSSKTADYSPFEITNALYSRNPTQLVSAIASMQADGTDSAFPAVAMILNTLTDLCCVREALDKGWLRAGNWAIANERIPTRLRFSRNLPRLIEGARRYTLNQLRAARHYAIQMRFEMVDSSRSAWSIIEPTLLRIISL